MKVGSIQDFFVLARQISNVTVMLTNTSKSPHPEYPALFNDFLRKNDIIVEENVTQIYYFENIVTDRSI